jgi:hypothetical protein
MVRFQRHTVRRSYPCRLRNHKRHYHQARVINKHSYTSWSPARWQPVRDTSRIETITHIQEIFLNIFSSFLFLQVIFDGSIDIDAYLLQAIWMMKDSKTISGERTHYFPKGFSEIINHGDMKLDRMHYLF